VIIAFYMLSSIADTYLTPVLTKISQALKLSETIAGVTLLAFANGAPDIIASATAGDNEGGVFISIGALFGACSFGATVVLGYCIHRNKGTIEMPKSEWIRDLSFYLIGGVVVLIFGWIGEITRPMVFAFGGIYVVYFIVILIVRN
jgi:solute carrier family 24 (sodium/potassium/calcium exchanger), member 6